MQDISESLVITNPPYEIVCRELLQFRDIEHAFRLFLVYWLQCSIQFPEFEHELYEVALWGSLRLYRLYYDVQIYEDINCAPERRGHMQTGRECKTLC